MSPDSVIYQSDFSPGRTNGWILEGDEHGSTAVVNEQLVVTVNAPNTLQYTTLTEIVFDDFVVEVDTYQRSGSPDSSFGLLLRLQPDQSFYRYDITGDGNFIVERHNADGSWTRLIPDWSPSEAINPGLNVANRLKVIANGPTLSFYVNDILLTQVNDAQLESGAIALDAGTFGSGNLQVSFDNIVVYGES